MLQNIHNLKNYIILRQSALTALIGADSDDGHLARKGAHVGDAVQGLDLKSVVGVSRKVHDSDGAVGQA